MLSQCNAQSKLLIYMQSVSIQSVATSKESCKDVQQCPDIWAEIRSKVVVVTIEP